MPDEMNIQEWQVPPAATAEDRRLGWLNSATQEGQAWLKSQRGFQDFRKALDTISGRDTNAYSPSSYRSRLNTNRLKRNLREVVGTLARLKPFWGYHSDNESYKSQAAMMNKVTRALYLEQFFDIRIKDALKFAAATGRGWVWPVFTREMCGKGQGNIELKSYGAPCVLPVQLPGSGDFQKAYTVVVLEEMPVFMAHGMWPQFQNRLRPSSSRYWYSNDGVRIAAQGNMATNLVQRIFGRGPRAANADALSDLLVPIRYAFIMDLSINKTDRPIKMGEPGASWSYTVPYVGQDIPTGKGTNRKADENDARLYPYRRLIISTDICITYDGPAFYWHGMLPLASFAFDTWPWEPMGFSLVHEGYEINEAIKEIERGNMDKIRAQLRPSLAYDTNAVSRKEATGYDPFQPDSRIGFDGSAIEGQPFQQTLAPEALKVTPESMAMIDHLSQQMDAQLALSDIMALTKLRAAGSMNEIEKIVEANGPIVEEMSRSMEPPMRDIGTMVKYLVLQYMTTARAMQYVGADGVAPEVFDFDPTSIVPSHLRGESPEIPSPTSQIERARIFADNLRFFILPNSLHEITQTVMKLGLIQLRKAGIMISSQTIAEAWSVPNYGTLEGNTEIDKWKSEQEMQLEFAARMKELGESLGMGGPPGAAGPGKNPEGRPNTNAEPPALKSKDNGARSTITTSK